ncbi:NADP-dependent oxidoreductase lnbE like protein [Verticillium longisporum]|nr:NADP-dependent oxidoreductase lnbE like protein [Verticillium longisporum]
MAPLTRFRADANHVASRLMLQYYTQRAAVPGTLLIAEATYISPAHCGGQIEGYPLYSSSPVSMDASSPGPEEMIDSAIWSCPGDSRTAAQNAIRAGFDGVEMHGVDEYFVGRFSQDTVNQRTDSRGCSVDNRSRFALKVVKAVTNAIGSNKVGMRLSPWSTFQGMKMRTDVAERQFRTLSAVSWSSTYLTCASLSRGSTTKSTVNRRRASSLRWTFGKTRALFSLLEDMMGQGPAVPSMESIKTAIPLLCLVGTFCPRQTWCTGFNTVSSPTNTTAPRSRLLLKQRAISTTPFARSTWSL